MTEKLNDVVDEGQVAENVAEAVADEAGKAAVEAPKGLAESAEQKADDDVQDVEGVVEGADQAAEDALGDAAQAVEALDEAVDAEGLAEGGAQTCEDKVASENAPGSPVKQQGATKPAIRIGDLVVVGILSLILCVLICIPSFMGSSSSSAADYDVSGGVAATVNGVQIGENDVTNYISSFREAQGLAEDDAWGEWLATGGYTPEQLRQDVANYFVSRELLVQAAADEGVEADETAIDEQIAHVAEQLGGQDKLQEALAGEGMTIEEYRQNIRYGVLQQALAEKVVTDGAEVDDEQLLAFLKMYYPDQVDEDADSLEGIDEQIVSSMREMLKASALEQGFNDWMADYAGKVDVVVNDMPEGLPYDIDVAAYQEFADDGDDAIYLDDEAADGDE